jgi:tetratricopeptide (TPR) repeat protein
MEPDFALPYSRLSHIYLYLGNLGKRPVHEVSPKAKEYAQKAIQLDGQAAESHEALANVFFYNEWKWDEAYRSLEKAIELNPSYAAAYLSKAIWFVIHENFDEAIETMRKSIQLDPFNPGGNYGAAAVLLFSGRIRESSDQLDKLFEISPHFPDALALKGFVYHLMGEYEKAMALFLEVQKNTGFEIMAEGFLSSLFLDMNQPEKAEGCLDKLLTAERTLSGQNTAYAIASIYAGMDKPDKMYHYLEKSVENMDKSVTYILVYPSFKKYHQDSRFAEIVKKIGLWK